MREVYQGEVFWFDLGPIFGSAPGERHPCVVVQSDLFNRSRISTTVDRSELVERIGKLPADTVEAIREGLQLLFDRM